MRRFSQKNQLVTLNEINITPLLDLAFVLLIIFVITTPLIEQSLKLTLPTGGAEHSAPRKDQVRTIEVNPQGGYVVKGHNYSLGELEQYLAGEFHRDPQIGVYLRADKLQQFGDVAAAMEVVRRLGIKKFDIATRPQK
jgi:biopolymer transport protein ExbD